MAPSGNGKRLAQKLLDLKERIEKEKSRRAELQGEIKSLYKQLKQDYSVESVEEAQDMLDEMETRLETIEEDVRTKIQEAEGLLDQGEE